MVAGLFYVYTEPGSVDEAEFHDWYDHEHGPARLKVPGFRSVDRYRALDDQKPPWLALYELDSPEVIDSAEYKALAAEASDRDKSVGAGLATLDRRIYEQISEDGSLADSAAPVVLAVAMSVPEGTEADLAAWYDQEHLPRLVWVPGVERARRYVADPGLSPRYLTELAANETIKPISRPRRASSSVPVKQCRMPPRPKGAHSVSRIARQSSQASRQ